MSNNGPKKQKKVKKTDINDKKKDNISTKDEYNSLSNASDDELKKLSKIIVVVILIVAIFYIITIFISKNDGVLKYEASDALASEIQYDDILLSNILKQNNTEYYVLVEDRETTSEIDLSTYESYVSSYSAKENSTRFYTVNLRNAFNRKYISDVNVINQDEIKVKGTVLVKVKDGNVTDIYEENSVIMKKFEDLLAESQKQSSSN